MDKYKKLTKKELLRSIEGLCNLIDQANVWMDQVGIDKFSDLIDRNNQIMGKHELDLEDRVYILCKEYKKLRDKLN